MGILGNLLKGKKPENRVVMVSAEETKNELKKLEKFSNKALGKFLEAKVREHFEKNEAYVIAFGDTFICGITNGNREKYLEALKESLKKMGDGPFYNVAITHDAALDAFQTQTKTMIVPASKVGWLGDVPERQLIETPIHFTVAIQPFYASIQKFLAKHKVKTKELDANGVAFFEDRTFGGFTPINQFIQSVVMEGNTLEYAEGDGASFLVPDLLYKEPRNNTGGFKTPKEALDDMTDSLKALQRKPETFNEIKRARILSTMFERDRPKIQPDKPYAEDWSGTSELYVSCQNKDFATMLPTCSINQDGRICRQFGAKMEFKYCKKCGTTYAQKDGTHLFRLEKEYWLDNETYENITLYFDAQTFLGTSTNLKTCQCGSKLVEVSSSCPKCGGNINIDKSPDEVVRITG